MTTGRTWFSNTTQGCHVATDNPDPGEAARTVYPDHRPKGREYLATKLVS